jgi:hypothetical protein
MLRRLALLTLSLSLAGLLAGCGLFERPQRPAWRSAADKACMARKTVAASAYVQLASAIDGPGICGLEQPLKVTALADATVTLNSTNTLNCPMTEAMEEWLRDVVQPIAMARFGQPVAQIDSMGAYACRPIDNQRGNRLSEHSFGNAVDIGGFRLADGRNITVVKGWTKGNDQEKAFLREVQAGACNIFTTVLAPGSDPFHYNHIHLDLAMHGQTSDGPRRICKPLPSPQLMPAPKKRDMLPPAPEIEDDIDIAQAGSLPSRNAMAMGSLNFGLPPAPPPRANASPIQSASLAPPAPAPVPVPAPVAAPPTALAPLSRAPAPPTPLPPSRPPGFARSERPMPPGDITGSIGARR